MPKTMIFLDRTIYEQSFNQQKGDTMPKKLDRCVKKVMKTGKSKSSSFAICKSSLKKRKKR